MIIDQWHVQPSEFDVMPYYRIEYMEEDLKEFLDAKNKGRKSDSSSYSDQADMLKKAQQDMKSAMPKMPSLGNFSNFKMPKI